MKIVLSTLAFLSWAYLSNAAVIFLGYMTTPEAPLLAVSVDGHEFSSWLAVGQHFEGFSIVAFDPITELLTVEKDAVRQALPLADGKIQTSREPRDQGSKKPIVISIGRTESISVSDDVVALEAVKVKLTQVASTLPQPTITIRVSGNISFNRVHTLLDLCTAAGITKLSLSTESL